MFRVKAVAAMFDVSPATIYRAIEAGQLTALKHGGGKGALRIPEASVRAYEALCQLAARRPASGTAFGGDFNG
jgi:excisionase family DNA binding protein